MSLKQFLEEEAARQRSPERHAERKEWEDSVNRVMRQIQAWLNEADPHNLLVVAENTHFLGEERLGSYSVTGLEIKFGARSVRIVPVARYVAGPVKGPGGAEILHPEGRIDLIGDGDRFILYRFRDDAGEECWQIIEDGGIVFAPFDRETFEAAIERLLS